MHSSTEELISAAALKGDGPAVATVAISNHIVRRFIPRKRIRKLAGDSVCCRIIGDAQRDQPSPLVPQDGQDEMQPKAVRSLLRCLQYTDRKSTKVRRRHLVAAIATVPNPVHSSSRTV
jgi:hypothetical protein